MGQSVFHIFNLYQMQIEYGQFQNQVNQCVTV